MDKQNVLIRIVEFYLVIKKKMSYWYTQQNGWIPNSLFWVKDARPKNVYNVWFHSHKIWENTKYVIVTQTKPVIVWDKMLTKGTTAKGYKDTFEVDRNILYLACDDNFTDTYTCQNSLVWTLQMSVMYYL